MEFLRATNEEHYGEAKKLFKEYALFIKIDLAFQQFDLEIKKIREMYSAQEGGITLCRMDEKYIGCVAIRKIEDSIGEVKRMFVQPNFQGLGVGKKLLEKALAMAEECNYSLLRLDTLAHMSSAIHLYKAYGFYEIPPYYHNPNNTAVFFEKKLKERLF